MNATISSILLFHGFDDFLRNGQGKPGKREIMNYFEMNYTQFYIFN